MSINNTFFKNESTALKIAIFNHMKQKTLQTVIFTVQQHFEDYDFFLGFSIFCYLSAILNSTSNNEVILFTNFVL